MLRGALVLLLLGQAAVAETLDEIQKRMEINKKVVCTVKAAVFKKDQPTEDYELFVGSPVASSSSQAATYGIEHDDAKIYFRYAMNTQSGLIYVYDKISGANATTSLRFEDLTSKPYQVGQLLLESNEKLKLLGFTDSTQIWADCFVRK